jgi:hypothetical protein
MHAGMLRERRLKAAPSSGFTHQSIPLGKAQHHDPHVSKSPPCLRVTGQPPSRFLNFYSSEGKKKTYALR